MSKKLDKVLVSIILLTYEHFEKIYITLKTIFSQDYDAIEILISDDASSSFPEEKIKTWIEKENIRKFPVHFRKNIRNLGIVSHSNLAAQAITGKYIKFFSPGDGFINSYSLSHLVNFAEENSYPIITSPAKVCIDNYSNILYEFPSIHRVQRLQSQSAQRLFSILAAGNIISAVGTLYHRSFFETGGFDTSYRNLEDWPTWLSVYRNGESIPCQKEPSVYYMLGGISSNQGTAFDSDLLKEDLRYCFEKEILPFKNRLSWKEKMFVFYRYNSLLEKVSLAERFQCLPAEIWFLLKKHLKQGWIYCVKTLEKQR